MRGRLSEAGADSATRGSATLRDVAALAGVSVSTVSNVARGRGNVREETRQRVQDAIDELGYRPNLAARRLRSGRSHVLGLALPSVTVPYFREFADSVLREAQEHGMSVRITQTHGDVRRERGVCDDPYLRHVDGILLVPVALGQEDMRALTVTKPLIVATASFTAGRVDSFDTDRFEAARTVVAHLVTGGRRRIAALAPGEALPAESDERYLGYVAGLRDAGLPVSRRRVVSTETVTFAAGAGAVRTLVERAPETDAVFALGDALALGALRGLRDAGRTVPGDIAVVGFGNVAQAAYCAPTLTTVDPGREEMAHRAVSLLAERAKARTTGAVLPEPGHHTVGFRLVERESSAVASE
ncbi:LacI family DNA-binding transcriptional regulator [Streptomyces iranensis]|uniref:DNA-binding LacI/PurR family transcriptional regulator n=1 Tax=Streptomyces iranensis TaxID=576784 RepID=A0A060ZK37_9ACTN|nr:LacI family DNA-binding transcriptional regulator [Streptomyces iranensis]MBP2063339.1 DNA-binding LacI/PurR family transcriptional regulator [Streptomyces iranensis]CDR01731.1 transcriptional regulator, LacI family [Streptomyces iranensis]